MSIHEEEKKEAGAKKTKTTAQPTATEPAGSLKEVF